MEQYAPLAVMFLLLGLTAMIAQLPLNAIPVSTCSTIVASTVLKSITSGTLALHHPSLFPASILHTTHQTSASLATTFTETASIASITQVCPLAPNVTLSITLLASKLAPTVHQEFPTASAAKKTAEEVLCALIAETGTM